VEGAALTLAEQAALHRVVNAARVLLVALRARPLLYGCDAPVRDLDARVRELDDMRREGSDG
jgi:hypothetical protein